MRARCPGSCSRPSPTAAAGSSRAGRSSRRPDFFLAHLYEGTPPEEVVDAARARVRDGARWVKVVADYPGGEHFNPLDPRLGYPVELVAEIAGAVHAEGGRLAVHVMGADRPARWWRPARTRSSTATGADRRHGPSRWPRHGTAWCPTLTTVLGYIEPIAERVPPARALLDRQRETLPLAAELGVTLLAGTDEAPHGSVAAEVAAMVRYGAPPAAALAAATTGARRYLGLPGLEPGAPADLVTFDRDPRGMSRRCASPPPCCAAGGAERRVALSP